MKSSNQAGRGLTTRIVLLAVLGFAIPTMTLFAGPTAAWAQTEQGAAHANGEASRPAAQSEEADQTERDENEAYRQSSVVKSIGSTLGMSPAKASITFEIINFVVLAAALGWFLSRALPKAFRGRTTAIQKGLVDARTATEEASVRLNSVEDRLAKLDEQIAALRLQSEKDWASEEGRIKASVEEEKAKILDAAEQEIAAATSHARRQIQQYAADLAIDGAAKKLVVSAETDRLLIQSFARRLGGDDGGKEGQN